MLIPAPFENIDLSGLPQEINETLTSIYNSNELFYSAIKNEDLETVENLLIKGYPLTWDMAIKGFSKEDVDQIESYNPPEGNDGLSRDYMSLSFESNHAYGENIFKENSNRDLLELLARYCFHREDFSEFKNFYFSTANDMALANQYLRISLKNNYPSYINGLLYHRDSAYGDLLVNADLNMYNKYDNLGTPELCNIFKTNDKKKYNTSSYKKIFDKYLPILIDAQCSAPIVKRVSRYEKSHAIGSVFEKILRSSPKELLPYIYDKYSSLTGVHPDATPIAMAYSKLKGVDIFFELEWESMDDSFKTKYTKEYVLSKTDKRRKNIMIAHHQELMKTIKESPHPYSFICESCESLGMPEEYYPELARRNKLENLLAEKTITNKQKI